MEFLLNHWLEVVLAALQCGILKFLADLLKERRSRNEAFDIGVRSLLRTNIIAIYHKAERDGILPVYALENLDDMYHAYKALGGNGAITQLYNQIKSYPHQKCDKGHGHGGM